MKLTHDGLWVLGSDLRYARHLSSRSASVTAIDTRGRQVTRPRWSRNDQTLQLTLSTALNLQPRVWLVGDAVAGDAQCP
jgi:hypothetical protein